jgi:anthranilate phosphoribosyltransferase
MSPASNRHLANELLSSVSGKLPGTPAVIAAANAHAILALADEVAALREAIQHGRPAQQSGEAL